MRLRSIWLLLCLALTISAWAVCQLSCATASERSAFAWLGPLEAMSKDARDAVYYDKLRRAKQPDAPWSLGDQPKNGHTHIEIYVTGRRCTDKWAKLLDPVTLTELWFGGVLELDRGKYMLKNPIDTK